MLLNLSMRLEKILILSSILLIFIVACSSIDNVNTADSCIIFEEKKSWYKSTKNSYTKWGTPISLQLAIINQESSFKQFAKPKRKRLLGLIPGSRPSSAFGYAQVTNPTWDWYKNRTGNSNASRANFKDITDFIGWYTTQTENILGISKNDYYNQYLAYHEGHNGWKNKSYNSKKWLIDVAKNVERKTNIYNNQLKKCEDRLNKKGLFGIF
ncbi:MAG: transglycosylase SLT domain-containing protein [Alphaproteobacteria bacterium]